jgi:hypothetical protein
MPKKFEMISKYTRKSSQLIYPGSKILPFKNIERMEREKKDELFIENNLTKNV